MGGCSAVNCSNHSRNKHRLFNFPKDLERRKIWTNNCRRDAWVPGPKAQLCSAHFEESQFEQNRADKWKKLKQTAIPTLFNVPNPPAVIGSSRIKGVGKPKPGSLLATQMTENSRESEDMLKKRIAELEAENKQLREQVTCSDKSLKFLSTEQKKMAQRDRRSIAHWSNNSIITALKMRFALGKFGYEYLHSTGYPCPSYSTLNRRIQHIQMNFGILESLIPIFKAKVDTMTETDKWCALTIDEMEIEKKKDFDLTKKC